MKEVNFKYVLRPGQIYSERVIPEDDGRLVSYRFTKDTKLDGIILQEIRVGASSQPIHKNPENIFQEVQAGSITEDKTEIANGTNFHGGNFIIRVFIKNESKEKRTGELILEYKTAEDDAPSPPKEEMN